MKKTVFLLVLLTLSSAFAYAEEDFEVIIDQKVVVLNGERSSLMDGDLYGQSWNKPQGYGRNKVLPALLTAGWRIKSIHVNEKSTEGDIYGYALLEKERRQ